MTLSEAVGFYHSLERFGIVPGLDRILILLDRLGSPQKKLRYIHVAGTNGKGSTCTALASVLHKAGYNVGLYTSPYVIDFCERIQYNMQMISANDLIFVTEKVKTEIEKLSAEGIKITEFEAVTSAAFLYYSEKKCDFVVLETGLGGRFDATNVIENPICSIITSISLDHTKILGDNISDIAFEKCGIIKPNSFVVTSHNQNPLALEVIKKQAHLKQADLIIVNENAVISVKNELITGSVVYSDFGEITIPWCGKHQVENISLVIECIKCIKKLGFNITNDSIILGIGCAKIPARTEIISKNPLVMLDGSHNDGSTFALGDILCKHLKDKKILAIMGLMADKDYNKIIKNLSSCFSEVLTVTPTNTRSLNAFDLAKALNSFSVSATPCYSMEEAVKIAKRRIKEFDALIVCGSLYLASDIRSILIKYFDNN